MPYSLKLLTDPRQLKRNIHKQKILAAQVEVLPWTKQLTPWITHSSQYIPDPCVPLPGSGVSILTGIEQEMFDNMCLKAGQHTTWSAL